MTMILVTGGTGLTGQFVVEELLRRGHAVRVLCRTEASATTCAAGAEVAFGDLRDPESLIRAARGTDGIIHAACTITDSTVDIAAMQALLAGWQTGPFVFISSLDVYGFAGPNPVTEDTPLSETYTDYGRGKVICERLLAVAAAEAEAAGRSSRSGGHVILRAPYIWGPHPTAHRRLVVQRLQDERLQDRKTIVLPGRDESEWGRYQDAWIDVRDLATIVAESLARPANGPLNVLTGHFTWHDLYVELIRLTGSRSVLVHKPLEEITEDELPRKQLYAQTWQFSEARLAHHLGTIPRRPFDVTVRDTAVYRGPAASG
jgi:nucleoside-diphosphate-sugar epimerase